MIDETTIAVRPTVQAAISMVLDEPPLFDDRPHSTVARCRPFAIALLLLTGGVRSREIVTNMAPFVRHDDILVYEEGATLLEDMAADCLAEYVAAGLLRCRDDGLFVATVGSGGSSGLQKLITWTCALNGQLPDHLLAEV